VPVTHLSGRKGRIEVSLGGVTFTRSESEAARRGTTRRLHVDWNDVTGAEVQTTNKGRPVIRVGVTDAADAAHHRDDPHAVKLPRKQSLFAHQLVAQINDEVAARRRWRQHAQS
jgi:hypothetical protein